MIKIIPKNIALLGSTGSIGENCLRVVSEHPEHFQISYLSAHSNSRRLSEQCEKFKPKAAIITNPAKFKTDRQLFTKNLPVLFGPENLLAIFQDPAVDLVVNAIVGGAGVFPTYHALRSGKAVALANKESLVVAGQLIMKMVQEKKLTLLPIDSEHSAIFQCLLGENPEQVRRIILTASGGPFRSLSANQLKEVTPQQALVHPTWNMGTKITIDSATLMNKGLEIIEAFWLYGVELPRIQVVIHPQSIIHSMVEFVDGSVKAQLGYPDMRIPIQFALTFPQRLPLEISYLDFKQVRSLTFEEPDSQKFPCLGIAMEAIRKGGSNPAVMNAANEVAVSRFVKAEIKFTDIPLVIEKTLQAHQSCQEFTLEQILEIQDWARDFARKI
jgi:1-deoxy-D-xylulose-5-phosphate reductoisomerase